MNPDGNTGGKRGQSPFVPSTQGAVPANGDCPLFPLLTAMLDGQMSDVDQERLADLLRDDSAAQETYIDLCWTHALLRRELGVSGETPFMSDGVSTEAGQIGEPLPVVFVAPSPQSHTSPFSLSSAFGGALFSYGVSAMIVGAMLLGAWAYKITLNQQFDGQVAGVNASVEYAGRISGMKDCRWGDPAKAPYVGSFVPLGRKYELVSGLLEITYKTGARVILEGPCVYEVDSNAGGHLAVGKLTARVKSGGLAASAASAKPQAANPLPPTSPLFTVSTPTAIVTDLGTEFGVEVDARGDTVSYVFQGSIKVQGVAAYGASGAAHTEKVLYENESIRVSRRRETHHNGSKTIEAVCFTHPTALLEFVRRMPAKNRVLISQNFDSTIFEDGDQLIDQKNGIGYSGDRGGEWSGKGYSDLPTVSIEHARSGSNSIYVQRYYHHVPSKLKGYTTKAGAPLTAGRFTVSFWLYPDEHGCVIASVNDDSTSGKSPAVYIRTPLEFRVFAYNRKLSRWVYKQIEGITIPTNRWIGVQIEVNLDDKQYDVWFNPGSGWSKIASNMAMEDKPYRINAIWFNPQKYKGQGTDYNRTWIDDVELRTGVATDEVAPSITNTNTPAIRKEGSSANR